jgi:hypothetical protein
MLLHQAAASPGGAVDWHPTWSPDSAWLAFQHGQTRRSGYETGSGLSGTAGALFLIPRSGGAAVRLDRASGPDDVAYRPLFSPFNSGGYFWLLFTTTRNYGNATAGVQGKKQIWVAAVRNNPDGTTDPSEAPYYLAGQEPATSLSPFWAPIACRPTGTGCVQANECCSTVCDPDRNSCVPSSSCKTRGLSCGGDEDCCAGLRCNTAHICDVPPPG